MAGQENLPDRQLLTALSSDRVSDRTVGPAQDPTVMVKFPEAVFPLESLTPMVKVYVPAVVGFPVMAPDEDNFRFGGSGFEWAGARGSL